MGWLQPLWLPLPVNNPRYATAEQTVKGCCWSGHEPCCCLKISSIWSCLSIMSWRSSRVVAPYIHNLGTAACEFWFTGAEKLFISSAAVGFSQRCFRWITLELVLCVFWHFFFLSYPPFICVLLVAPESIFHGQKHSFYSGIESE